MMMVIFSFFFLIPLVFYSMGFFQYFLFIVLFIFLSFNCNFFYSSISYFFGIDFFSFYLVILSIIIFLVILLSVNYNLNYSYNGFLVFNVIFLFLFIVLLFFSMNMFVMYLFFEFSLFPLIVCIFGWGYQPDRLISSLYLFFYTLFASLPLLFLIIYLYLNCNSLFFDYCFYFGSSFFFYLFFNLAFLVKLPIFLVHFWLPRAHVQAPVFGSMVLAGILLKIGGYGLIRFMYMIEVLHFLYSDYFFSFCIYGCLVVSLLCLVQSDFKVMIAYSSIVHMSMSLMGILSFSIFGLMGSFYMMLSHGLCSSGLFYLCNIYYSRLLSRSFFLVKGMIFFFPSLSFLLFLFSVFNMGCPPSLNFFSELMIFLSSIMYFNSSFFYLLFISFFSSCFCFYMFSYSQHGFFSSFYSFFLVYSSEYLVLLFHLFPLFLLILGLSLV
uniref:NADH dehydrogenase subunit 4 n=1 Tax=Conlopa bredoni TaxID=3112144 RepID=UPI002E7A303B|nr:NADH dehydrogenase subunit 4 [Conlopa bredoni]WRK21435.1 NADH dehydrogenase subunit 4 [Conlopa bredoni]